MLVYQRVDKPPINWSPCSQTITAHRGHLFQVQLPRRSVYELERVHHGVGGTERGPNAGTEGSMAKREILSMKLG